MALLRAVAAPKEPASLSELASACGLNPSTACRLLATLEKHAMVELNPDTNRYTIGYGRCRSARWPTTAHLCDGCAHNSGGYSRPRANGSVSPWSRASTLVYVDQLDPPDGPVEHWIGRPMALHASSSGKILLAHLPPEDRAGALPSDLLR
jgi:DNA-binding IclR family transcriptional regulator